MMLLQPFIDALDIATGNGWMELPESYGARVFALAKGAGHRYIRRVPKAGGGYRYYYHVGHGGGVANTDHFVEGAAFQHDGGHFHIKGVDGDKLTIEHDETGEKKTVTKAQLRGMLTERHGKELDAHRAKVHADLADAKRAGASPKQLARLEARAKAAGADSKSSEELRADVERTKSELDKTISDIMVIAGKKELRPGDKAKVKEWLNLVAKHGQEGTPVPAMNKRDVYGKHKHSIMWAYSDDSRGLAGVRQDRVYEAAKAHGDALRAAGSSTDASGAPKMSQAIADASMARDSENQRAAATKFEAKQKAEAVPKAEASSNAAPDPDTDAIEHMRHRRSEAAKPRSMNEWAKTAAAEEKDHAWTRHIPAGVKSEKGKFRVSNSTGGREVEGSVSGVWGLSGDTVTHIPTGLSVYVGDGAKHAFAVFATHAPKWGADGKFDDGNSVRAKMGEIREGANTLKELLTDRAVRHINDATSRVSKIETAESRAASVQTSGPSGEFRVKAKPADFEKAHKRASIFASQDASRQSITSVHSDGAGNLVATDGRRIAIIPTSHSESGNYSASGRKTNDTNYPDYERLIGTIPKGHKAAEFNADSLRSSIQAHTAQLAKEGKAIRVVQFGPDGITSNADSPSTHAVQHRGEVTEFGIDPKMLSNALAGAKGTVRLHSGGRFDPIHIEREDGERHLIMPMRI